MGTLGGDCPIFYITTGGTMDKHYSGPGRYIFCGIGWARGFIFFNRDEYRSAYKRYSDKYGNVTVHFESGLGG